MARPTKLTPEIIQRTEDYLKECINVGVQVLLPTIEGLALSLEINRDTLYEWEKENTKFSDILGRLRSAQAQKLIQNGLVNRYNPTIAKLLLSKHGYVDKSDITSGGEKLNTLNDKDLDAIIARASKASKNNKA